MNIRTHSYTYVCDALLSPVAAELARRGHAVNDDSFPDVVLLAADNSPGSHDSGINLCHAMRGMGVPTVSIQHGAFLHEVPFHADVCCAWGPAFAPLLDGRRVEVTGNPRFDGLLAVEPEGYALFVGGMRNQFARPAAYAAAIEAVAMRLPVVAAVHPNPHEKQYAEWFEERGCDVITNAGDGDIEELVASANIVFGKSSVLVMAAVMGVPAITCAPDIDKRADNSIYLAWNGDPEVIDRALSRRRGPFRPFVAEYAVDNVGSAARVADLVDSLALDKADGIVVQ